MNIHFNEITHEADIWLTTAEKNSEMVSKLLEGIYSGCKQNNFDVTVFISGKHSLTDTAAALVLNQLNKNVSA